MNLGKNFLRAKKQYAELLGLQEVFHLLGAYYNESDFFDPEIELS